MQEPLPYADEPLDLDGAGFEEDPAFPVEYVLPTSDDDLLPFPASDGAESEAADHAASQREILLAQHRERMNGNAAGNAPGVEYDESAAAFPGAAEAAASQKGVSQREIIMQQQREILLRQAGVDPSTRGKPEQPAQRAEPQTSRSWLTRRSALAALVISLSILVLAGGTVATGQDGTLGGVAGAITPDVIENWLNERVSGIAEESATPEVGTDSTSPATAAPATVRTPSDVRPGPVATDVPLRAVIVNTGGDGVAVRTICIREARTTDTLAEGAAVRVIGRGVGDCAGWSVIRAGAQISWIENEFLGAPPTP